jgi:hypothetical protein
MIVKEQRMAKYPLDKLGIDMKKVASTAGSELSPDGDVAESPSNFVSMRVRGVTFPSRGVVQLKLEADEPLGRPTIERIELNSVPIAGAQVAAESTWTDASKPGTLLTVTGSFDAELSDDTPLAVSGSFDSTRRFAAFRSGGGSSGGTRSAMGSPSPSPSSRPREVVHDDDPQKGRWGGLAVSGSRRLSATVERSARRTDWFDVTLRVVSLEPEREPLTGSVTFHLHSSFRQPERRVRVVNGEAFLRVTAYGAFTVGVEADNGETRLEQDLAELSNVPRDFRLR